MRHLIIFCLLLVFVWNSQDLNYTFYRLSQQRGGSCLDGSPPGLYIHEGKGENKQNFMIYFDSGGYCGDGNLSETLQSCYKRSFTTLGSTNKCTPTKSFNEQGLLSPLQNQNPLFYDWTKVFANYCDGTQYAGSRESPIPYKDRLLYFRGANNVKQQLRFLQENYDIYNNQKKIVVTGVSAGGIATYLWSNYMISRNNNSKIYAVPDSGLFLTNYFSPIVNKYIIRQRADAIIKIAYARDQFPIPQCLDDFGGDFLSCFNAANLAKYLKVPMLIVQSPYDAWSVQNILGAFCMENPQPPFSLKPCNESVRKAIDDYSYEVRTQIKKMIRDKPNTGAWSPSCAQHGFTDAPSFNNPNYKVPTTTGRTVVDAIRQFLENPKQPPIYIDSVDWPYNKGCNGLHNNKWLRSFQD